MFDKDENFSVLRLEDVSLFLLSPPFPSFFFLDSWQYCEELVANALGYQASSIVVWPRSDGYLRALYKVVLTRLSRTCGLTTLRYSRFDEVERVWSRLEAKMDVFDIKYLNRWTTTCLFRLLEMPSLSVSDNFTACEH